jgi:hypothetical protein
MIDPETRKKLISAYKERSRTDTGGVYMIKNTKNGKILLEVASDIEAAANRFSFAQKMGGCINYKLNKEWAAYGSDAFTFEIAETIDKNEEQSPVQFREDLNVLKKMWAEKFEPDALY